MIIPDSGYFLGHPVELEIRDQRHREGQMAQEGLHYSTRLFLVNQVKCMSTAHLVTSYLKYYLAIRYCCQATELISL